MITAKSKRQLNIEIVDKVKKELIDEWYKEQARANSSKTGIPEIEMQNAGRKG